MKRRGSRLASYIGYYITSIRLVRKSDIHPIFQSVTDEHSPRQAARTLLRNSSTSLFSRFDSFDSDCAEDSTCEEAAPVSPAPLLTSVALLATCEDIWAAC